MDKPETAAPQKPAPISEAPGPRPPDWPPKADPGARPPTNTPRRRRRRLLKADAVATILNVSVSQVYALHASGRLKAYRITTREQGGLRFSERHVRELLDGCERGGEAPA